MRNTVPRKPREGNSIPLAPYAEAGAREHFGIFTACAPVHKRTLAFQFARSRPPVAQRESPCGFVHGSLLVTGTEWLSQGNALRVNYFVTANPTEAATHKVTAIEAVTLGFEHQHRIEALPLVPTLIVEELPGWWKCWWLLDGKLTKLEHDAVVASLVNVHGGSLGSAGWDMYHRLPGFRVNGLGSSPHLAMIVGGTQRRTSLGEMRAAYLDSKVGPAAPPTR